MKNNTLFLSVCALIVMSLSLDGCYYDNAEDLYPQDTIVIDSNIVYTYTADVKPILETNCAVQGCHVSGTGRQPFTTYTEVKNAIENFNLNGRIQDGSMPPSGSIPQTQIDIVVKWIENNYPEN